MCYLGREALTYITISLLSVGPRDTYSNVIKVGGVVVVMDPMKSRPYWSLGRVMEVTPGDDDLVGSAKIRKPDRKVQENSIKHLYSLMLSIIHSDQAVITSDENSVSNILALSLAPKDPPEECTKKI